jgi:hypothetical protein
MAARGADQRKIYRNRVEAGEKIGALPSGAERLSPINFFGADRRRDHPICFGLFAVCDEMAELGIGAVKDIRKTASLT